MNDILCVGIRARKGDLSYIEADVEEKTLTVDILMEFIEVN